jgi:aminopeptidase
MRDPRIERLADVLVNYSTEVREGDVVAISGDPLAQPLLLAVYEQVLRAGGRPIPMVGLDGVQEAFFALASDDQLEFVNPVQELIYSTVDVTIGVQAPTNSRALTGVDPSKQARVARARHPLMTTYMERAAKGELRWVGTVYPTEMVAADAEMSLRRYEDLYYAACLCDRDDPIAAWKQAGAETHRLNDWMNDGRQDVHIRGDGTDLRLSVEGRTWVAGDGKHNMPCGEFFTGPVEDSANGHITFHLPTLHGGRSVSGIRFEFQDGKVVGATAEQGEDYLIQMLDSDEGARFLGELGIGSNFGIDIGTRSILLDEKIGGTVHLAIGQSYPETGGTNQSAQHWDMICDLREGGSITVDGALLQQDGRFLV